MTRADIIEKKIAERENMMQMFYQMGQQNDFSREAYDRFLQLQVSEELVTGYSEQLFTSLSEHLEEVDAMIDKFSLKWKTSRMPAVDLAILRLAMTEILYIDTIPVSVSINEAVNMAKKFSTEKSSGFINGLLGSAVKAGK